MNEVFIVTATFIDFSGFNIKGIYESIKDAQERITYLESTGSEQIGAKLQIYKMPVGAAIDHNTPYIIK